MKIELWPIDRVNPYFRNPRVNDSAVAAVAASLNEFGFCSVLCAWVVAKS